MSEQNQSQLWEKRADETPRSYAVFCIYRDMGSSRSVAKAVETHRRNGGKSAVRYAEEWSVRYSWSDRVEQYDLYMEAAKRLEQEAKYLADLENFNDKQRNSSSALLGRAIRLLKLMDQRLDTLTPDMITVQALPVYLRAVVAMSEAALGLEAQALGVEEVIRYIKQSEARQKGEE